MAAEPNICVGVTGGIAAYRSCELVRDLRRKGAGVRVAMTESACRFVSPLTFASLTEEPVVSSLFYGNEDNGISHIELARWSDVVVICPATADFIGKVAAGLADDILSTMVMATTAKVIFCPAMNSVMWENSIVQENVARLKRFGYIVVEPEWGSLATTSEGYGVGRLASIDVVVEAVFAATVSVRDLAGKRVLVSAGPTRERIDPIRFITNFSSGKMGFAIAETARLRGAEVTLIAGPNRLRPPSGVTLRSVESALEMERAINDAFEQADILIMAAAVADYRPAKPSGRKVKKAANRLNLELVKTTDILAELGKRKGSKIHVGFALETDAPETNARKKLADKNLDLVVLNNPFDEGAAFGGDTNVVTLLSKSEEPVKLPRMSKRDVANHILDRVVALCATRQTKQVAVQV